jgi:gluconolactonase
MATSARTAAPTIIPVGSIQRVDLHTGTVETLYSECNGVPIRGPNDIVFDSDGGFWFTDYGKSWDRLIDRGAVYYARADGSSIKEAAFPLITPNGIGLSPDGKISMCPKPKWAGCGNFRSSAPASWPRTPGPRRMAASCRRLRGISALRLAGRRGEWQYLRSHSCECGNQRLLAERRLIEFYEAPEIYSTNICFGGPI